MIEFDKPLLDELLAKAGENPRLRHCLDLRTTPADTSQRILNALLPGTVVPVHRHEDTDETVICVLGELDEVIYEAVLLPDGETEMKEVKRIHLSASDGCLGCQVPKGMWHSVEVKVPAVIFEAKDGAYKAG